ncbi:FecR domain-containing protein [Aeoliella sp.]|uniref:FecR domain-containing protein n=1 Tax=Aeoliella sp. TaxID=2795800 RepID=UPI003CCC1A9D
MAATQGTKTSQVQTVGRVVSLKNVKWTKGAVEFDEWSRFDVGQSIAIDAGVVSLMMDNSAEIKLEGPADFRLTSAEKAVLSKGNLVARCGPEAVGFQVESPDVDVVDLGTEFGVSVREGQHTDVVVYDGKVDLTTRVGANPLERRLTAGEALQISHLGEPHRITQVRGDQHLTPLYPLDRGVGLSKRIVSVSDRLPTTETVKFYRVVGGGFGEDCRAYVDRSYEWNGVDQQGLPPAMVGGDYVMTFNDDKVLTVEIEVELAMPSTLYVLLDDRVPLPRWLLDNFFDTGWDVGMDEMRSDRRLVIGVGAGASVDHVFSVWRRDVREASLVTLGPIRQEQLDVSSPHVVYESMYGVVVTELVEPL